MIDDTFLSEQRDFLVKLSEAQEARKEWETRFKSEKERQIVLEKEALEKGMALSACIMESKENLSELVFKLERSTVAKIAVFAPDKAKPLLQQLIDIKTHLSERKSLNESDVSELEVKISDAFTLLDDSTHTSTNKMRQYQDKIDILNKQIAGLKSTAKGSHLFLDNLPTFIIASSLSIIVFKAVKISHFKILDILNLKGWLDTIYYPDSGFFIVYLVGSVAAFALATYNLIRRKRRRSPIISHLN